jgi:DNA-binding NtrC family response regulator
MPHPVVSDSPTPTGARSHDLLRALTTALEVLGSSRDPTVALEESFAQAVRAFGAEKALLLRVKAARPLQLERVRADGLSFEEVRACLVGESVDGVSPSRIRQAVETGEPQLVENSHLDGRLASETASLHGRPHSVLCAPVTDPWTRSVLAVLYFQTRPGPGGYSSRDVPFVQGYATALGHAFGLFLTAEQRYRELEEDYRRLHRQGWIKAPEIIGDSEEMSRLRAELHETYLPGTVARNPRPVLILGETGTGKDLVARYLHYYSPRRARGPFLEYNCAGLSGDLVQTTLFGHARGAFTGATDPAPGLFRGAHEGTLFLDEIGELPPAGQELLLKVLDHWTVLPVGEVRAHPVDVQLLAATSRDLEAVVRQGRFRRDLYHRLKPLTIRLTPLARRSVDVRPLLAHFLAEAEKSLQKKTRGLTAAALRALLAYEWPGNVRELAGVCAALVSHCRPGAEIDLRGLSRRCPEVLAPPSATAARFAEDAVGGSLRDARETFERDFLVQRLELCHWNVPEAARGMGISAATLYRHLHRHGLRPTEPPRR